MKIIGAGLAGCEAAWALANAGIKVKLYEAKPKFFSPAHHSENFAELVCSNSLKSAIEGDASALLKEEMRALGSLILQAADATKVPAGKALAVDRGGFSKFITEKISSHPNIEVVREEVKCLRSMKQEAGSMIIATGPLTSPSLSESLRSLLTHELYFYDAIAPIISADSIDMAKAFRASRYDVGERKDGDYINCPMDKVEYENFIGELLSAEKIAVKDFDLLKLFEGCQPIESMAEKEKDFPRHGPMKPVGLADPRTGKRPYAVVQLRQDDLHATLYNMVGFQTRMLYSEQERVFKKIPGLENAKFARFGSMHRNTFINSPLLVDENLQLKGHKGIFIAGQLTGVEGYLESAATGLYLGVVLASLRATISIPVTTAIGALIRHITRSNPSNFQPSSIIWGIFPPLDNCPHNAHGMGRSDRRRLFLERARHDFAEWLKTL